MFYFLDTLNKQIRSVTDIRFDIKNIILNSKHEKEQYNIKIEKNKEKVKRVEDNFTSFENIKGIPFEPFELEKITFEMVLDIKDLSILELFNNVKLSDNVPFVSCNYFYKIRKDFIPPLSWDTSSESLVLKVMQKDTVSYSTADYADVIIDKDIENNNFKVLLNYSISNNISKEQLINRFLSVLTVTDTIISNVREKHINGTFYFPNQRLNKYIMSDIIMNKNEFSEYLSIDESSISQKPTVFVHFYTPETGGITAFLTEKIVNKKDQIFNTSNVPRT
jgi:hypothetical protein